MALRWKIWCLNVTNTKYDCHGRTPNPNIFKFFENISHPTSITKVVARFVSTISRFWGVTWDWLIFICINILKFTPYFLISELSDYLLGFVSPWYRGKRLHTIHTNHLPNVDEYGTGAFLTQQLKP